MAGASGDGDGKGRWQVRGGEKVAAGWCLVRVSGMGKYHGSLQCWGSPEVTVMEEDPQMWESWGMRAGWVGQAVVCKGEKQWCCFIFLHHAHPSRLFLPMGRSARPGVAETQQHRQEGSGGSWSRDKHCFAQCRPACTAPPSAPHRLQSSRKRCSWPLKVRERCGGAGGGKQGWRASLLLGAAWQAGRLLPLFFLQLGDLCGTTGSSAG